MFENLKEIFYAGISMDIAGDTRKSGVKALARRGLFPRDVVSRLVFFICASILVVSIVAIFFMLGLNGLKMFTEGVTPGEFLFTNNWYPDSGKVGAAAIISGSLVSTALAILIGTPISLGAAIFFSELAPRQVRELLRVVLEILVGIPSVVYGWVGLTVLVPFAGRIFDNVGFSLLAGGLVLSIMILPTVTSVAADSLNALPIGLKNASLSLGATQWQTIWRVLVPSALPGILAGVILGIARAIGEALAVQMVIGNAIRWPVGLEKPISTMTSTITMGMGSTAPGSVANDALFSLALLLLALSFMFIIVIRILIRRMNYL